MKFLFMLLVLILTGCSHENGVERSYIISDSTKELPNEKEEINLFKN